MSTRTSPVLTSVIATMVLVASFFAPTVGALDASLAVFAEAEHDNNAKRERDNERSDVATSIGLDLGATHDGQRLLLDGAYTGEYTEYKNGVQENETLVIGATRALMKIVPGIFEWSLAHQRENSVSNLAIEDSADNRETSDILSTGPNFIARLSKVDYLSLTLAHTEFNFSGAENPAVPDSDADGDRQSGSLNWSHRLSPLSSINVGYSQSQTGYDANQPDLDAQQYHVSYNSTLANGRYQILAGGNSSKRDGGRRVSGPMFQVSWLRNIDAQTIDIAASHQLTDSSLSLGIDVPEFDFSGGGSNFANADQADVDQLDSFDVVDTIEHTTARIGYRRPVCDRCQLGLDYGYDNKEFDQRGDRDTETHRVGARFTLRMSRVLTTSLATGYRTVDFSNAADQRKDEGYRARWDLRWNATEQLQLIAATTWTERKSNIDSNEYEALAGSLVARYVVF